MIRINVRMYVPHHTASSLLICLGQGEGGQIKKKRKGTQTLHKLRNEEWSDFTPRLFSRKLFIFILPLYGTAKMPSVGP